MGFIRQRSGTIIQVGDVVNVTMLSRRVLERRFRSMIGRSIFDEIKRVHVDQIAEMMLQTDMAVSEIALSLGYINAKHIARLFQQKKGLSPMAYRKYYGNGYESS